MTNFIIPGISPKNIHPNIDFTDEGFGLYANGAWDIIESTAKECNVSIKDFGHNPDPISKTGRCCDSCNSLVIMARINQLKEIYD